MAHDVFISYSKGDKPTADALCNALESLGIRCWVAPRDVFPGADWSRSIIRAIATSRLMVLVFSSHANASKHVTREVHWAFEKGLPVIPLRVEEVVPTASLQYFIGPVHWLDALTPPLEAHLRQLAARVRAVLDAPPRPARAVAMGGPPRPSRPTPPPPAESPEDEPIEASRPRGGAFGRLVMSAVVAAVMVGAVGLDVERLRGDGGGRAEPIPPKVAPTKPDPVVATPPPRVAPPGGPIGLPPHVVAHPKPAPVPSPAPKSVVRPSEPPSGRPVASDGAKSRLKTTVKIPRTDIPPTKGNGSQPGVPPQGSTSRAKMSTSNITPNPSKSAPPRPTIPVTGQSPAQNPPGAGTSPKSGVRPKAKAKASGTTTDPAPAVGPITVPHSGGA